MNNVTLNISGKRRLPLVRQAEAAECGLACLAMIAAFHGHAVDLGSLRKRFSVSLKGTTLKALTEMASALELASRPVRAELGGLSQLTTPCILHWDLNHFVVLKSVRGETVDLHDPALGAYSLPMQEVSRRFTGVALELMPTERFQQKQERQVLGLRSLIRFTPNTRKALAQLLVLALIIELGVLASPLFMQLIIDEAILNGDQDLLAALGGAFGLLLLFMAVAATLRGLVAQFLGSVLSFETESRVFHHLVRLPLEWFHKRQIGDIQVRFNSVEPVKRFVANDAVTMLFDGIFGVLVLVLMTAYAPMLACIVAGAALIYAALRFVFLATSRRYATDVMSAEGKEQSRFLETLRAAQTIKMSAGEAERAALQQNAIANTINASIRLGNLNIGYSAMRQGVLGGADILVVLLGAVAVMSGDMTIGMLTAFVAYKLEFFTRATRFIESVITFRLLDVHLERLADIVLAQRERDREEDGHCGPVAGELRLQGVRFRYAHHEPDVLSNVSADIRAGEFLAITGASGAGKSTLLKILVGLYAPSEGRILVDGRPISAWNLSDLRRQFGVVMQDDQLLQGTIAENIASFETTPDMDRVQEVVRLMSMHDDICRMPMGYQTMVGDMGSALSSGQKQRVMIARALYNRPRVLILDEGTAHLDASTETAVCSAIARLAITRIVVSHRRETLKHASRCLVLTQAGTLVQSELGQDLQVAESR